MNWIYNHLINIRIGVRFYPADWSGICYNGDSRVYTLSIGPVELEYVPEYA